MDEGQQSSSLFLLVRGGKPVAELYQQPVGVNYINEKYAEFDKYSRLQVESSGYGHRPKHPLVTSSSLTLHVNSKQKEPFMFDVGGTHIRLPVSYKLAEELLKVNLKSEIGIQLSKEAMEQIMEVTVSVVQHTPAREATYLPMVSGGLRDTDVNRTFDQSIVHHQKIRKADVENYKNTDEYDNIIGLEKAGDKVISDLVKTVVVMDNMLYSKKQIKMDVFHELTNLCEEFLYIDRMLKKKRRDARSLTNMFQINQKPLEIVNKRDRIYLETPDERAIKRTNRLVPYVKLPQSATGDDFTESSFEVVIDPLKHPNYGLYEPVFMKENENITSSYSASLHRAPEVHASEVPVPEEPTEAQPLSVEEEGRIYDLVEDKYSDVVKRILRNPWDEHAEERWSKKPLELINHLLFILSDSLYDEEGNEGDASAYYKGLQKVREKKFPNEPIWNKDDYKQVVRFAGDDVRPGVVKNPVVEKPKEIQRESEVTLSVEEEEGRIYDIVEDKYSDVVKRILRNPWDEHAEERWSKKPLELINHLLFILSDSLYDEEGNEGDASAYYKGLQKVREKKFPNEPIWNKDDYKQVVGPGGSKPRVVKKSKVKEIPNILMPPPGPHPLEPKPRVRTLSIDNDDFKYDEYGDVVLPDDYVRYNIVGAPGPPPPGPPPPGPPPLESKNRLTATGLIEQGKKLKTPKPLKPKEETSDLDHLRKKMDKYRKANSTSDDEKDDDFTDSKPISRTNNLKILLPADDDELESASNLKKFNLQISKQFGGRLDENIKSPNEMNIPELKEGTPIEDLQIEELKNIKASIKESLIASVILLDKEAEKQLIKDPTLIQSIYENVIKKVPAKIGSLALSIANDYFDKLFKAESNYLNNIERGLKISKMVTTYAKAKDTKEFIYNLTFEALKEMKDGAVIPFFVERQQQIQRILTASKDLVTQIIK